MMVEDHVKIYEVEDETLCNTLFDDLTKLGEDHNTRGDHVVDDCGYNTNPVDHCELLEMVHSKWE